MIVELDKMNLEEHEKAHLIALVDSSIQHAILDAILSELSEKDKKAFFEHLSSKDNDKIWSFLNNKVENIEDKIKKAADDLKEELHKDIKEAKEKDENSKV